MFLDIEVGSLPRPKFFFSDSLFEGESYFVGESSSLPGEDTCDLPVIGLFPLNSS